MLTVRYKRHLLTNSHLPFIFHSDNLLKTHSVYPNWHDNAEFIFCLTGSGTAHSDSTDIPMKPGDTIIINPRCLHYFTSPEHVSYHCLIIDNSFFRECGFDISKIRFDIHFSDEKAGKLMSEINTAYKSDPSFTRIAEIRLAVLNYVLYICKTHITEVSEEAGGKISKSHEAILRAVDFIDKNYEKKLTVDEIASVAGFSKYHLSRLFKNYTGFTVVEHINGRRCETAKVLLENRGYSVSQIATECGFESCSYFAKAFERSFGMLPSEYRKLLTKN